MYFIKLTIELVSIVKLKILALTILILLTATGAHADKYPSKPIKLFVTWPAGGAADGVGRALAQALTTELGQSVLVENIAGAGGNIGTQQFVRTNPDGYTLLLATSSTNAANPYLYKKVGFEPISDFVPIVYVADIPSVMVVATSSSFQSPKDVIVAAKLKPGKMSFASGGVGNSAHLAGSLFKSTTGIDVIHVPYKGSAPALTDVMSGQVDYMLDTGAYSQIKGGKVRALAVASPSRHPILPDVPTFDELGIKSVYMSAWYGLAAPANSPAAIVNLVNAAINNALKSGDLKQRLATIGAEAKGGTPSEFAEFWRKELVRYESLVRITGATLD
jgi:tripartite-type tricarboxylate transporter receptor subunit TctC